MTSASYSSRAGHLNSLCKHLALLLLWVLFQANLVSGEYGSVSVRRDDAVEQHGRADKNIDFAALLAEDDIRVHPTVGKLSIRQTPTYESRVEKGRTFQRLFPLTDKKASQQNGGKSVASRWRDPDDLDKWGWYAPPVDWTSRDSSYPRYNKHLDTAFDDPANKVDKAGNGYSLYVHANEFVKSDGGTGQPTDARYGITVNPKSGAIVFDLAFSPAFNHAGWGEGDVPDLEKLSDVAFFQWTAACKEKGVRPKNIRLVYRAHVTYEPSFKIVTEALQRAGHQQVPDWDNRITFTMDQEEGLAILGSVHGASVAFFLIQHKATLGLKKITEVTVWSSRGAFEFSADPEANFLMLRFKVENA